MMVRSLLVLALAVTMVAAGPSAPPPPPTNSVAFDDKLSMSWTLGKASVTITATLAAEATARAVVNAVHAARSLILAGQTWPAASELTRS
mgnify:CR=1 FL=1